MKKYFLLALICLAYGSVYAQPNPDSLAYQNQRKIINDMLAARAAKFSQYDASLSKHTGIFGMQTKKDIRRSNDILMDIVSTDNNILQQTKVLLTLKNNQLDYRTFQQQSIQTKVKETEDNTIGFMTTINKLRNQNEKLKAQVQIAEKSESKMKFWLIILLILFIITSILLIAGKYRTIKA
ncbi:hypothetical protein [Mucilaginibacter polytrichastri]|uniref:Uncharacterized protein n=1 Tax=Mucilaginibacter polytrichastri TaxID=1302689 RepID=A0A1Q5ZWW3_9SPHI|nr:hypothetical protein [Mucilaginibacter polytrichastri]OKS86208.1 hypothetical protein RG47T_1659 [Mucilaginibacter polytrichastri]SFT15946.1 hypothetical protein SAMN04487890_11369 [Mucilaginibacter polytrichastri]